MPVTTTPDEQPYRVLAVGSSGAGKTVYLASMYRQLRLRRQDSVFFLTTAHDKSLQLNSIYNQICDPKGEWPLSSSTVQEWVFTVQVNARDETFLPVRFSYLDYPGSVLTNPRTANTEAGRTVAAQVKNADAMLVLIDGQSLLHIMARDATGRKYEDSDLVSMLEVVQHAKCPVHFIITKWDLLEEQRLSLTNARQALEAIQPFRDVLASLEQGSAAPIRLIPVSSVGPQYVIPQPDGSMKKNPDKQPSPQNVEIPLMAVIPDFMRQQVKDLENTTRPEDLQKRRKPLGEETATSVARLVGRAARLAVPTLKNAVLLTHPKLAVVIGRIDDKVLADRVMSFAEAVVMRGHMMQARRFSSIQDEMNTRRQEATTVREALSLVLVQFMNRLQEFEKQYPESVLNGSSTEFLAEWAPPGSPTSKVRT